MIIGIYGYIASGKSTASKYIEEKFKFKHINADEVAKQTINSEESINVIKETFPEVVVDEKVNKELLKEIVFQDADKNKIFTTAFWPIVNKKIVEIIEESGESNFVIESIGLNSLDIEFDLVFFIKAPKEVIFKRLFKRNKTWKKKKYIKY